MVSGNTALNSYQKAQVYDEMDPNKLILMLYEGAIKRIALSREGLKEKNPQKRGENLGKAIAIISELNASLDESIQTEEVNFLRSLYNTMLIELPKVSVNNDVITLDRTQKYLMELRKIWETTVMSGATDNKKNFLPKDNNNSKITSPSAYGENSAQNGRSFAV